MVVGLIIDAFGELRDQQEQVKEDMEVRGDCMLINPWRIKKGGVQREEEWRMGWGSGGRKYYLILTFYAYN